MFSVEDIKEIPERSYMKPGDEIISIQTTEEDGNIAALVSEPGFGTTGQTTFGKQIDAALTSEKKVCKMTFNRVSTQISHHKTHSDEKPYKCHICPEGFHQKGAEKCIMEEELSMLKKTLISLVVSSPTTMTVSRLLMDYRSMVGRVLPLAKYGYREPLLFLKERCADIFVIEGPSWDPILTPKVTKNLAHIDQMVQKQKWRSNAKYSYKGKRRSILQPNNRDNSPNRYDSPKRLFPQTINMINRPIQSNGYNEANKNDNKNEYNSDMDFPSPDSEQTSISSAESTGQSSMSAEKKSIMEQELSMLKKTLISLVVSSPTTMTVSRLLMDYRSMVGRVLPLAKYGYREPLLFLKERCADIFVIEGPSWDPILTPKVTKNLAHIDQMVQKQKWRSNAKYSYKGKRRSILQPNNRDNSPNRYDSPKRLFPQTINMINRPIQSNGYNEANKNDNKNEYNSDMDFPSPDSEQTSISSAESTGQSSMSAEKKSIMEQELSMLKKTLISLVVSSPTTMTVSRLLMDYRSMVGRVLPLAKYGYREPLLFLKERCADIFVIEGPSWDPILTPKVTKNLAHIDQMVQKQKWPSNAKYSYQGKRRSILQPNTRDKSPNRYDSPKRFFPQTINMINRYLQSNGYNKTNKNDNKYEYNSDMDFPSPDLEQTSMSSGSKQALLEQLKKEIQALIHKSPGGVWCSNLIQLYKETYGRELEFNRFGHTCLISLIYSMEDLFVVARSQRDSDWLLLDRNSVLDAGVKARVGVGSEAGEGSTSRRVTNDNDDALPGVDFDTDVFPPDSLDYLDSVPGSTLEDLAPGSTLEVMLGEVYSPSHFWILRVGEQYHQAMELIMDHMNEYYNGEGNTRVLARGALRVGQYCAVLYHGDWHRALIVCIDDKNDTVKVRHLDYGTVDSVSASTLKPLLREWGALPAQAIRGRLAAVRPASAGWRWPRAACATFLHSVRERRLYAHIRQIDHMDDIVETFLIDTSGKRDICLTRELIRVGHADTRHDSALQSDDCYLYPRFEALESGATPNYADICHMLADGIRLEYVDTYRRHVPGPWARPPAPPAPAPFFTFLD